MKQPLKRIRHFFSLLGPGLITGAADDDPSGIATYSIVGAQLGTTLLWTAWVTWPMMAAVQMMCARIGMMTGQGLAGALKQKFSKPMVVIFSLALLVANTINIAADLTGMAGAANLLTGVSSHFYVVLFGVGIGWSIVHYPYQRIVHALKWLALSLFAYVATAFILHPDWALIGRKAFTFSLPHHKDGWEMLVAVLGTTISPYLFFWQASQEVEERNAAGRGGAHTAPDEATRAELAKRMIDIGTGTFLSNMAMFFIILTTALTLHKHGLTQITTSADAAEALRPLAGDMAMLLYTVGLIGLGLLTIPTLAGSAAYALAETFDWSKGLDAKFRQATPFYTVVIFSVLGGMLFDFLQVRPMDALFWSAIINGILAPCLLVGILAIGMDKKIMHGQPSSRLNQMAVAVITACMFAAAIAMVAF